MNLRKRIGETKRILMRSPSEWKESKRVRGAMKQYSESMKYSFDINSPALFTEKVIWYKLFFEHADLNRIVDKYLFKGYIREKLGDGYTIALYDVFDSVEQLKQRWDSLPKEFVLKSTLMSDGKGIKIIHDKDKCNFNELCREASEWLNPCNTLLYSFCRAYYGTTPRIIAEAYEAQADGQLYDYKVFCFQGEPKYFYVATDHFPGQLSHISFFDLNWNRLDVQYGEHPHCDVEKPAHFDEMLRIAKTVSKEFPFLRVDFFDTDEKIYLSELTLYPGGGLTPIKPESFNRELGDQFILPEKEKS